MSRFLQSSNGVPRGAVVSSGSVTWTDVTGTSQTLVTSNGYVADNASQVAFTLPTTAAVGDFFIIVGKGAGGWKISQNAGQSVIIGTTTTVAGTAGYLQSTDSTACVELVCTTANTVFTVRNSQGATNSFTGAAKGYVAGGSGGATAIQKLVFSGETTSTLSATLSTGVGFASGCSSSTKGYNMGGNPSPGRTNVIYALTFSGEIGANISATLSANTRDTNIGQIMSSSKGYVMGGDETGAGTTKIQALTFSGETTANLTATLDNGRTDHAGCCSSTKGYSLGGFTNANASSIEDLTFSGETSVTISATLGQAKYDLSGVSSTLKGYVGGGFTTGAVNVIEALTFSGETTATLGATLDSSKYSMAGVYSLTKGYWCGGNGPTNVIENMDFNADTSAAISATLPTAESAPAGFQGG